MKTNRKHIQIYLALISILLFAGQLSALTHSVEHPFHTADKSCEIFVQLEKSGNGLIFTELQLTPLIESTPPGSQNLSLHLSSLQTLYFARAPPYFS